VWVEAWKHHPPDIYVTLWALLRHAAKEGEIRSCEEVRAEIEKKEDGLLEFLDGWGCLYLPVEACWEAAQHVISVCPSLINPDSHKDKADPFVVGLALENGWHVVSKENRRKELSQPIKIPDACDIVRVPHLGWFEFLRLKGWTM